MTTRRIAAALLALLVFTLPTFGQALADRVPDDAIVYIGWNGADSPGAAYANSHLNAVLDNCKMREFFSQFVPQVARKFIENEPDAERPINTFLTLWKPMWKYPSAIFFSGIDLTNPNEPAPRIGLICKAGADSANVKKVIDELLVEVEASDAPFPIETFDTDGMVGILVGYPDASKVLAGAGGGPAALKASAAFTGALKQVQADPMLVVYFDVEKLVGMVEQLVQADDDPQAKEMVPKVIDALGIRGLKRAVHSAGFDGQDWMSMTFFDAPAPRKGLLELMDGAPVSSDLLKAVPVDATFAAAGRFDPARLINQIKLVAGEIDPNAPKMIDQGLGGAQMALAKNLMTDILEPMGSDWAMYCSPTVAGNGILGLAVVNKLDDPAKAQASLPTAFINLSNWANVALSKNEAEVEIRARYTKINDLTVYYVGIPVVAPAWAIKDGYLYGGFFPQSVSAASASTGHAGKSITQNEKFIALQKRLGVKDPCGFTFYDLQTTAASGSPYQQILVLLRYAGFGDLFGVPAPEPLIPPLPFLQQHLGPAGSASWIDDAGWHNKSVVTFPGAKMLSEPGMLSGIGGVGGSAILVSILLPSLNRARETANRVACASNLRQIGQGILIYANDHQGAYPPDLGILIKDVDITAHVFICPSANSSLPDNLATMTPDQIAAWVNDGGDYVYAGQGLRNDAPAEIVIVHERFDAHDDDGMNLLFADGHVEFMSKYEAIELLEKQKR